jgi:cytochrome bd-type quinol oxidase subunit 2
MLFTDRENPMADETHHRMSEEDLGRLKILVSALAVIYVMTFLSGFLQDTQFNLFNYIFFSLLFIGGIALMSTTVKSKATGKTKAFLFLTGISTTLLLILYIGYEWFRLKGYEDLEGSIEALLYWITLSFGIGVVGSLVLIRRLKGLNSSRS